MTRWRFYQNLITLLSVSLALAGCDYFASPAHRDSPVTARDFLLDESAFPANWRVGYLYAVPPGKAGYAGEEALELEFRGPILPEGQDGAGQAVYRFRNAALAASSYKRMQNDIIFFGETDDSGKHPENWRYRSSVADDWRFACDLSGCGVIARYDEFVLSFSASMTTPSMTPAALETVFKAIDQRMTEKLGKPPATPTASTK